MPAQNPLNDALRNLPVFEGQGDEGVNRALLTTGLGLLQPQDQLTGGGFLGSVSNSIGAGLAELDTQEDRALNQATQAIGDRGAEGMIDLNVARGNARTVTAEAARQNAETNAAQIAQGAVEFDAESALREADVDLKEAQAEWLRRRHSGAPSDADTVTTALIEDDFVKARMTNLFNADPAKYTLPSGDPNTALLMDQAFLDMHRAKGTAGNENVPIIAAGEGEAASIGGNITALQGVPPAPAGTTVKVTINDQADLDAKKASGEVQSGDTVIFNGEERVVR